jgi:hypothetical protein
MALKPLSALAVRLKLPKENCPDIENFHMKISRIQKFRVWGFSINAHFGRIGVPLASPKERSDRPPFGPPRRRAPLAWSDFASLNPAGPTRHGIQATKRPKVPIYREGTCSMGRYRRPNRPMYRKPPVLPVTGDKQKGPHAICGGPSR